VAEDDFGKEYWKTVYPVGELKVSESTTIKFEWGVRNKDRHVVISIRTWVQTKKYSGPTKAGFILDSQVAEKFYELLGKAIGKGMQQSESPP
jgi:hypothetical protein